jgi:hypothetical protein
MPTKPEERSTCVTYEVIHRDENGEYTVTPFSDLLASSGITPKQAITKMRKLQDVGWLQARTHLTDDKGQRLIVRKDDVIWLLKCKPSCWRLYFYVIDTASFKYIVYVHAVCKKQDKEDPRESEYARRVADKIRPGGSRVTAFEFPIG